MGESMSQRETTDSDLQLYWLTTEAQRLCLTVAPCPRCDSMRALRMLNVPVFHSTTTGLGRYTLLGVGVKTELCVECRKCKLRGGQAETSYYAISFWNTMARSVKSFDDQCLRLSGSA